MNNPKPPLYRNVSKSSSRRSFHPSVAAGHAEPTDEFYKELIDEIAEGIISVDLNGVIRVQRSHSVVRAASAGTGFADVRRLWEDTTIYNGDSVITPDIFVIIGSQIIDLSGVNSIEQALAITRSEFDGLVDSDPVALISIPPSRGL